MVHEIVAAMIVQSNMVLLGLRSSRRDFLPGVWDVFGGHTEPGENQRETLVRELQEELGITPSQFTYEGTFVEFYQQGEPRRTDQMNAHLYLVTVWSGTPKNLQPEEHDRIQWFSLDEAVCLKLASPTYPELFTRYLS